LTGSGSFYIDEEVLVKAGMVDLSGYAVELASRLTTVGQLKAKTAHRIAAIMLPPANRPEISIN